ncbi:MAG: hypothetical protein RIM80_04340 [Alphaproteobacteria bacterium]
MRKSEPQTPAPVAYMERTRQYYRALGYPSDYRWASHDDAPYTPLAKPLAEARIAVVVTSAPPGDWSDDNPPPKAVWSGPVADAPAALFTQNLAWDKESTHTRDRETYLPIAALGALAESGVIGGLTERFHSVPTVYSHRETMEHDAPAILQRVRADRADAALLVPL